MTSYRWLKSVLSVSYHHCRIARQGPDLSVYTSLKCCFLLETVREKYSYISEPNTISSWPQAIRNLHKEFAVIFAIQLNRKCMKVAKFGIPVNKTTYLFPSIRGSNISRWCGKILEIPQGMGVNLGCDFGKSRGKGGHMTNPFRRGGMDIFWNHTFLWIWSYMKVKL